VAKIEHIRKRDGRLEEFDENKVTAAIYKAAKAVGGDDIELAKSITHQIVAVLEVIFKDGRIPTVENIQDLVEKMLIEGGHAKTAKAYIIYREQHEQLRKTNELVRDGIDLMDDYIQKLDWRVNENSNMSYSLQGLNNHISSTISALYWLEKIYPKEVANAHKEGELHIHDLGMLSVYCCGWDLENLLLEGLGGVTGKIESRPPMHLRTALGQIVNYFYTLQGEAAGAQAFSSFDTYLAPYIRYDDLSYDEVKQALQEFIFNVNVPTRVGFQTPFTNVTMDLICPKTMKDDCVIIGGKRMKETYKEFQREMDMFNTAFAEIMMAGDSNGRIFTVPIPTYNITKDFDWDNPKLEKIWEMTAKYGIPYFSNFINSDMDPSDARSMCCRLRLDNRELKKKSTNLQLNLKINQEAMTDDEQHQSHKEIRGGGLFGANPMTGSIGVVTVNLPRLAYISKDRTQFFTRLAKAMDTAKESLEIKRKVLERFTEGGLYPYSKHYLRGIKQTFGKYWSNHFSTIGLVGMNEAALIMENKNIGDEEGRQFALETLKFMRERLDDYKHETNSNYNLEASPAEGTSYRLARKDKEKFPDINTAGSSETPYYTNSTQLPVGFTDDIFEALSLQDELQCQYTGGTVFHGFLGERVYSTEACKKLVKKIAENFHLPYYTITPTFSICPVHGYIPGEHEFCPYEHNEEELKRFGVDLFIEKGE